MAYIRPLANGRFRADIRMKCVVKNKTFSSESLAQSWADKIEHSIKTIPNMDHSHLAALDDNDVAEMGGDELFKQLGVDLYVVRNKERLDAMNALTKKELLALSTQEIERMGGVELFLQLGKRIRYKTFNEVCKEYLSKWNKKDFEGQMQRVAYWCNVFGDQMMTDIDKFDVQDFIDSAIDDGQRATTINRKKAVLSSVFKYALGRGYIDSNIIRTIVIDDDTKQRDRVLTDEERKKLIEACKKSHWKKLHLLVLMAMTTGARQGELMSLRWCDISFNDSSGYIPDSKNGTSREIHFAPIVMTELKLHQEVGNGFIFVSKRKPDQPLDIRKSFSNALRIAKISEKDILKPDGSIAQEKFTFHCLRHGFCTQLSDSGKELSQIAKMAGHKSLQTTLRYIHQDKNQKRKITSELVQAFGL
ncbi:MAG: site-specific integrase [Methylobacter sp.]|nr:site-specific integrase [Candidatus Methylobacter titanis]